MITLLTQTLHNVLIADPAMTIGVMFFTLLFGGAYTLRTR